MAGGNTNWSHEFVIHMVLCVPYPSSSLSDGRIRTAVMQSYETSPANVSGFSHDNSLEYEVSSVILHESCDP